jgi:Holliday junction resolvase RusA-like endonuclease
MTSLSLPFPPSTNGLYKNVKGGRVKTARYLAWQVLATLQLREQAPQRIEGRYRLSLTLDAPDALRRDADNFIKAVSDLLVSQGIVSDDHLAKSVFAEWSDAPPAKPGKVTITLEPAA